MAHVPHLDQLALLGAVAVLVAIVLARVRLPTVAGFLVAGAIIGPGGLGLVRSLELIEVLAEVGVVFLLFSIGLEFSVARLRAMVRLVVLGGGAQVGLTALATIAVALAFGRSLGQAVFYGFVLALSSTAIVLRELAARRELDAPHGRFVVGALVLQDLCVVPMVLVVPVLGAGLEPGLLAREVAVALGLAAAVVVGTVLLARLVVPRLFDAVDASRSREVFLLAVLAICLGTAWLTSLAGLSLALGAFLAGVVVADTEFGHRAMGDILPIRDAFVSVFFVSLGMLFDGRVVLEHPWLVAVLLVGFLFGKAATASIAALALRLPARGAWLAGVALAQFGEFGFVLTRLGQQAGVIEELDARAIFAAGIVTMFLAPLLLRLAPHFALGERLLLPVARWRGGEGDLAVAADPEVSGHVVVCGFGIAGKLVGRALQASGIPFVVLELNVGTVRAARSEGFPIYYGDASSPGALEHAGLVRAAALVLVLNDPAATERIVDAARRVAPGVPILVRVHYLAEARALTRLGATDAVAEEVESGVELVARLLRRLEVPRNDILERIEQARAAIAAAAERPVTIPRKTLGEHRQLAGLKVESVRLPAGSVAIGRTLRDLDLRRSTGALAVAIGRGGGLLDAADLDAPLREDDVVFVVGTLAAIGAATDVLTSCAAEDPLRKPDLQG